ncbi:MAG: 1-acyl-sn-glycerol-3-phosphate acyltransferase [Actinomycetota bacterium]|nr:1-acyl-sn-glycerol-3-phosphate acyltransferase [Actinomycetota bacterium]
MLYRTLELTLAPALRAVYRPRVTGLEHVPANGPVIIAANHVSFADEFFTPLAARRQVFYFAKAEYFTSPGIRGKAMAAFFNAMGQVPVARGDMRSAAAVIDIGVEVLAAGRALGIYPEGTRSPDGRLHKFRTGVARLALRSGASVVPVGLVGTRDVQPPDSRRWHRAQVEVNFGAPLQFAHLAEQERSARVLREVTEQIRTAVQELSGQDYVNSFGSNVKAAD